MRRDPFGSHHSQELGQEEGGWRKGEGPATPLTGHPGLGYQGANPHVLKGEWKSASLTLLFLETSHPGAFGNMQPAPQRSALGQQAAPTLPVHSRRFLGGCACWSRPLPWTLQTSPWPVGVPHQGSSPVVSSCSQSPSVCLPAS